MSTTLTTRRKRAQRDGAVLTLVERIRQALAYGRVSTDVQRETETIRVQQVKLLDGIKVRDNDELPDKDRLQLAGEFWDEGVSGTIPLDQRAQGRRLVGLVCGHSDIRCMGRDAKAGELGCDGAGSVVVDELWITKLDRLGRTLQILIEIEQFLRAHGVALVSLDFGINTSTPVGRLIFAVLGAIAQWERETIIERTTSGKYQKAADGKWTGGRYPYGLTVNQEGYLVVDEQLITVVEQVVDNIALHGATAWSEGIRTGLGEARVRSIVHNSKYKGEGGLAAADGRWIAAREGKTPQVIEPWKWQLAQDALTSNSKNASRNRHYDYLLTGDGLRLLTCCEPHGDGICGRTFAGRAEGRHDYQAKYVYYYCSRSREEEEHTSKMLRGKDLEDAIWSEVEAVLRDPGKYLDQAREQHSADGVISRLRGELTGAIGQLARLAEERQTVLRYGERKLRTDEEVEARCREIAAESAPLEAYRAGLEVQLRSAAVIAANEERAAIAMADIAEVLDAVNATDDRAKKRQLIKAVVQRAEVRTVNGASEITLHLAVGVELVIGKTSGHQGSDNQQKHEPIIVVRTVRIDSHHRRGPAPGSVRRPDTAARNAQRAAQRPNRPTA